MTKQRKKTNLPLSSQERGPGGEFILENGPGGEFIFKNGPGGEFIYSVIGLMSGTSLDGVDIAFCRFRTDGTKWLYEINLAETVPYNENWRARLTGLGKASALDFVKTDTDYGFYLGELVLDFMKRNRISPDFISSHGHTIFHQPEKRFSTQIGKGSAIAAATSLPVVCDFRSLDVNLGGQGAPLVPVGDNLLFADYNFCLNLGGFGNISFDSDGKRIAYDLCPVNIVLNYYAAKAGLAYDKDGAMAGSGKVNNELLKKLDDLSYYSQEPPKSLGKEWLEKYFLPLTEGSGLPVPDILRTACEHIAAQITANLPDDPSQKMLVTGGGALNKFLVSLIREKTKVLIVIPENDTINYKEAMIFAFLGVLRWREEVNCLSSVTGASRDNIGGAVYFCSPENH